MADQDFVVVLKDELSGVSSDDVGSTEIKEITKSHWLTSDKADKQQNCMNRACKKPFSLFVLKHHCRMCGKIFCSDCLKFRKRLNKITANLDPQGQLYQVCSVCNDVGKNDANIYHNVTHLFMECKLEAATDQLRKADANSSLHKTRRHKLNLEHECERLLTGFQKSFGKSEMRRSLHEMKTMLTTPDWQKSSAWMQESIGDTCQGCKQKFGLLQKKYTCKLCGQCRCKACKYKELLVYIPDDLPDTQSPSARLAVIRVVGSPQVEPEISLLLHVCGPCREYLTQRQTSQVEREQQVLDEQDNDVITKLLNLDGTVSQLQNNVSRQLIQFQEVVESLEGTAERTGPHSNIRLLAKAQTDIADNLASLCSKIPAIKALLQSAETPGQKTLCNNYIKAKSSFYLDNIFTYRQVKSKLYECGPLSQDDLAKIQGFVDQNAIVSVQVYIRQLVFETIAMCQKYNLHEHIPTLLTPADEVIEEEACQCLMAAGEDMQQHNQNLKDIVKAQMKERRLIRPSKRLLATQKSRHAADIMLQRTVAVIDQVKLQLDMKTLQRSFKTTKLELDCVKKEIYKIEVKKLMKM